MQVACVKLFCFDQSINFRRRITAENLCPTAAMIGVDEGALAERYNNV